MTLQKPLAGSSQAECLDMKTLQEKRRVLAMCMIVKGS